MAYAILRTTKLKTIGQVAGSLSHTHRTRPTPNADPERLDHNEHYGAATPDAARSALINRLPTKRRKDAVLCIEYFIGASPEFFQPGQRGSGYFRKALEWLKDKHGAENVIAASVHRDETSPHLVAYVVPVTADGRLAAKDFIGGKAKMSAMQTDFAATVGAQFGLERGIEGSQASHTTIKQYYAALSYPDFKHGRLKPSSIAAKTLQKGFWKRIEETPEQIADRVTRAVHKHYEPVIQEASMSRILKRKNAELARTAKAKAKEVEQERELRAAAQQREQRLRSVFMDGLSENQQQWLLDMVQEMREENALAEQNLKESRQRRKPANEKSSGPEL